MKKIITSLTFILFTNLLSAQIQTEKGNFFLSGNINYNSNTIDNDGLNNQNYISIQKQKEFQINPNIGYFVKKNLAIGTDLIYNISQQKTKFNDLGDVAFDPSFNYQQLITINTYGIAAFVNYYVPITDKLSFLCNNNVGFAKSKIKNQVTNSAFNSKATGNTFGIAISPGLVYFITPKISFQTQFADLHYTTSKITQDVTKKIAKTDNFGIGADTSTLRFGFSYYFR